MKKQKKYLLVIFIFSIFIMLIGGVNGYIKGHDTNFHVANISAVTEKLSLKDLLVQEPLKFIGNNFGYGTRFFYPPIPHLMAAVISKILGNVILGMRITEWFCFLASGITFFYLMQKILNNAKISTILALFYMAAPYHLSQIFIRGAFSEMFIPISIPLIVLGLLYLVEKDYKHFLFCFVVGYTLAVYSHLAMSIYFTLILIVTFFTVYFKEIFNKKNILYLLIACILILLLTASFWLPLLEVKLNTNTAIFVPYLLTAKGDLQYSTVNLKQMFEITPIHSGDMIFHLSIVILIMFVVSIFLAIRKKIWKEKTWIFLFLFTVLSGIMSTKLFPWKFTPSILQTLQFPWRLALYTCFGAVAFCGIFIKQFEVKRYFNVICIVLAVLAVFNAYYYIGHLDKEKINLDNIDYNYGIGNQGEYFPEEICVDREYYENRTHEIVILSGNGDAKIISDEMPNLHFEINVYDTNIIELPRVYYLGYELEFEGEKMPLEKNKNGFIQARIEKSGTYSLVYKKTFIMRFSLMISFITFISLIIVVARRKENNKICKIK